MGHDIAGTDQRGRLPYGKPFVRKLDGSQAKAEIFTQTEFTTPRYLGKIWRKLAFYSAEWNDAR